MSNIYNAIQNLYNMDKTTWQEVLAELYNIVSNVDNKFDLFEIKFGSLLGKEVTKELKKMCNDGSLSSLINDKLLKDINTKVDAFKTKVSKQMDTIEGKTFEVVNCVGLGIDTTNTTDISIKVNQIIQENQGKTIFIPKGNYRVDNPIIIKGVDFICEGTIFVGNNVAFHVNSPYIKVNINKIVGVNEKGTGVLIGSSSNTITNCDIYINKIDFCENAILISPEGDNGVQCSKIHFNTLYKCKYGIRFKPSNTGIPWINENTFYCGSINSKYAIYVKKGDDMVDPFNNNKFLNISIEFSSYPFILEYMNTNTFENIRCAEGENTIADYMFNLSSCNLNTFTSNIPNSISRINEVSCNNNIYDFIIQREVSGAYIGASMKTNNGRKFLKKSAGILHDGSTVGNYNKTTNTIDYVQKIGLINMSCDANKSSILVLDSRYGVDGSDYNEFMVDVQFIGNNGLIQIKNSSGTVLLDQSKLTVGKHLVKYIGGNWYSFKAS